MSVYVSYLDLLGQTARLIFPSVTRWPVLFTAVARICMRRPLLRITKAPRLHPGPSSIIYFTLNAGTRSAFSELSCKVRCRSFCSCPCKKWLVSSRRKSEVHAPASCLPWMPPFARYLPGCSVLAVQWENGLVMFCRSCWTLQGPMLLDGLGAYFILLLSRQGWWRMPCVQLERRSAYIGWRGPQSFKMAESLSVNNVTRQIAREDILNNQRRESFKSYDSTLFDK